MNGYYRSRI